MAQERLQKLMAQAGLGSRRACEEIIEQGRVSLNGHRASLGMRADPEVDDIRVDGERLRLSEELVYIALNKPRGVISDEDVAGKRDRARDIIPLEGHLYPVGRLDLGSEGLMLFTNDGVLAHKLTHPSFEHPKTYHVVVEGSPSEKTLDIWRRGISLDGKPTGRAEVVKLSKTRDGTLLEVTLREGRKRQIRRTAAVLGHPAVSLLRIKIGPIELGDLPSGGWRRLTDKEIEALQVLRSAKPRRRGKRVKARPRSKADAPKQPSKRQTVRRPRRGPRH
ncbi:MAG: rRNA pseudouridine synthase [Anaerolineae bacterium]|nr:rRNA pseudouridine synthase [Anaerolineae bacterium]